MAGYTIHKKTRSNGGSGGGSNKVTTVSSLDNTIGIVKTTTDTADNYDLSKVISGGGLATNYVCNNYVFPYVGGEAENVTYYKIAEFTQTPYSANDAKLCCVFDIFSCIRPETDSLFFHFYFNCRKLTSYSDTDFKCWIFEKTKNEFSPQNILITVKQIVEGKQYSFAIWAKACSDVTDFKLCFGHCIDGENISTRVMCPQSYWNKLNGTYTKDDITTLKSVTVFNNLQTDGTKKTEIYDIDKCFVPKVVDLRTVSDLTSNLDSMQKEIDTLNTEVSTLNINVNGVIEPFEYLQADNSDTFTKTDVKTSYALSVLTKSAIKTNNIEVFVTQNGVKNLRFAIYDKNLKLVTQTATYNASSASMFVNIPFTNVVTLEPNTLYYIVYGVSGNGIKFIGRTMTFINNNLQPALYSDPNAFNKDFSYKNEYGASPVSDSIFVPYFKIY